MLVVSFSVFSELNTFTRMTNIYSSASGSSPPKLSRVGANSKAAAQDEDEEEKENTQCKSGPEGGDHSLSHGPSRKKNYSSNMTIELR